MTETVQRYPVHTLLEVIGYTDERRDVSVLYHQEIIAKMLSNPHYSLVRISDPEMIFKIGVTGAIKKALEWCGANTNGPFSIETLPFQYSLFLFQRNADAMMFRIHFPNAILWQA